MWRSDEEKPSTSSVSARPCNGTHGSVTTLEHSKGSKSLLKRAISLQFLTRNTQTVVDREKAAYIKMRYKDTAKYVIWPTCRLPDKIGKPRPAPIVPTTSDPRTILMEPDIEDHRSPYMPATINHVLRSDSEDSSDAEQVLEMTRL